MYRFVLLSVIATCAMFASAQNARVIQTVDLEPGWQNRSTWRYDELPSTPNGTVGMASYIWPAEAMRVDTVDFYGNHRRADISFYTDGFAHGRTTDIVGLASNGFAVTGFAENASRQQRPFVAYIRPDGSLGWKRFINEYPLGLYNARMRVFSGPDNTFTVIYGSSVTSGTNYIQRFNISGSPIGFRGALGTGIWSFVGLGNKIAVLRPFGTLAGTTISAIETYRLDGVRVSQALLYDNSLRYGGVYHFSAIEFNGSAYVAINGSRATLFRFDSEGNHRWTVYGRDTDAQSWILGVVQNQLHWTGGYMESPWCHQVGSFGDLNPRPVAGSARGFDAAGPVGIPIEAYPGSDPQMLWGGDLSGNTRFSLSLPRSNPSYYSEMATLAQGRLAIVGYHGTDIPEDFISFNIISQAPVIRPNSYRARFETVLDVSASSGVLGNDLFAEGLIPTLQSGPTNGTLTFNTDGSFRYIPRTGFVGTDSFVYRLNRNGDASTGTATITVRRPGDVVSFPSTNPTYAAKARTRNLHLEIERTTAAGILNISSSNLSAANVPPTIYYGPNTTVVTVPVTVPASSPGGTVTITAHSPNFSTTWRLDIEQVDFSGNITTPGITLRPGSTVYATVTIDRPATSGLGVEIKTDASNLVTTPATATFPVGSTSLTFPIQIRNTPTAPTAIQLVARRGTIAVTGVLNIAP